MATSQEEKDIMSRNLRRVMLDRNVSQADLSRELDIPITTVSYWCTAKTYPRIDKIERMARYFGVSKADLIEPYNPEKKKEKPTGGEPSGLTEGEAEMLKWYRMLPDERKTFVRDMLKGAAALQLITDRKVGE